MDSQNLDRLVNQAKVEVAKIAERESPSDFCSACNDRTPLSKELARDVHIANEVSAVADELAGQIAEITDSPKRSLFWVDTELSDHFYSVYWQNHPSADSCEVCVTDHYDECGHEIHGGECPMGKA